MVISQCSEVEPTIPLLNFSEEFDQVQSAPTDEEETAQIYDWDNKDTRMGPG
jgi:hypothetical protein